MTIPYFSVISAEFLKLVKDKRVRTMKQIVTELSEIFNLSKEDKTRMKKSGNSTIFSNRVHWTKFHLKQAGLVTSPKKGHVKITNNGIELLKKNILKIDRKFLENYSSEKK